MTGSRYALLLASALALQLHWQVFSGRDAARSVELPPAPSPQFLKAASLGEPELAARATMIWLQAFDLRGDNALRYAELDYGRLTEWLRAILETDPRSTYPLFSAALVYAEVADPVKSRVMLEFLFDAFQTDPERRWPWLAHAALLAKHRLQDLPRALRYARAIEQHTRGVAAPLWAKQMQAFLLEDRNGSPR